MRYENRKPRHKKEINEGRKGFMIDRTDGSGESPPSTIVEVHGRRNIYVAYVKISFKIFHFVRVGVLNSSHWKYLSKMNFRMDYSMGFIKTDYSIYKQKKRRVLHNGIKWSNFSVSK